MLKATNLHKSYRKKEVVRGVNIEVEPGQVVGLLGPNGAGKTTCFYMIVGLIPTDKGSITVDDVDITHKPVNVRSSLGVGYLPQEASVFRKLSVQDNIMAILELRRDLDLNERKEMLQTLMEELGVSHLASQMGQVLSGGELAENGGLLRQVAEPEPGATVDRQARDLLVSQVHAAAVRDHQPRDDVEGGRLAGAVRAEQPDHLTQPDSEGDAVHHATAAVALLQTLCDQPPLTHAVSAPCRLRCPAPGRPARVPGPAHRRSPDLG